MPAKAKGFKSFTNHSCLGSCRLWVFFLQNCTKLSRKKKISGSLLATWVVKKNIRSEKVKQTHFRIQWCHKSNQSSKISKENQIKPMYISTPKPRTVSNFFSEAKEFTYKKIPQKKGKTWQLMEYPHVQQDPYMSIFQPAMLVDPGVYPNLGSPTAH